MGCFSISSVIIISNLNSNVKRKSISRTESNHPRVSEPKFLFLLFVSGWEVHPNRLPSSTGRELKGILSSSLTLSDYSIRYRWSIVKSFFKVSLRYSEVLKDIHEPRHTQYTKPKRKCQVFFLWGVSHGPCKNRTILHGTVLAFLKEPLRFSEISGIIFAFLWEKCRWSGD